MELKWYNRLRWKLFFLYFAISFVPLVIFSLTMNTVLENYFEARNEQNLLYQANKLAGTIKSNNYLTDPALSVKFSNDLDEKSTELSARIIVLDKDSVVIADTNRSETDKILIIPEVLDALQGSATVNLREDTGKIYTSAGIDDQDGQILGAILLVYGSNEIYEMLASLSHDWLFLTIFISIIIAVIVYITSSRIIKPLSRLVDSIGKIADGDLRERVDVKNKNEIGVLGNAINIMAEKLESEDSSRSEFVSNVSHELKTPLSSIKVLSESILLQDTAPEEMYKEFLQDINSEIDRMTNIINDLLSLVKLDNRESGLNLKETNLRKMLIGIMKTLYPLAKVKDIELTLEADKDIVIEADETKLSLAISNLIDNAIKYTPAEGVVKVTLENDHQNAFISVMDTGIGISEEEQPKIFNRFYRTDKTRDRETGGTGLGLAITHSTVLLHSGSIKVLSKEGSGATFIVRLPIKQGKEEK
ncbi:MAG: HAMP domain-containing histidine kinase [Clostridiales bacterium]|nr:HAMP domain-containing histidine kinase [Clostridiales bacterium]